MEKLDYKGGAIIVVINPKHKRFGSEGELVGYRCITSEIEGEGLTFEEDVCTYLGMDDEAQWLDIHDVQLRGTIDIIKLVGENLYRHLNEEVLFVEEGCFAAIAGKIIGVERKTILLDGETKEHFAAIIEIQGTNGDLTYIDPKDIEFGNTRAHRSNGKYYVETE